MTNHTQQDHPTQPDQPATARAYEPVLVLMGVSGCGKSTIAGVLAGRLGWDLEEGDDLHPQANIEKMAHGHGLTDEDRQPWLELCAAWIRRHVDAGRPGLLTCSSLKSSYRDILAGTPRDPAVVFVYLHGSREQIAARLRARHGHFMPASLLDSQFADLEEPGAGEHAIRVEIGGTPAELADRIVAELGLPAERS